MVMRPTHNWLGLAVALAVVAGCAGAPEAVKEMPQGQQPIQALVQQGQAPKWITQKGAAFSGDQPVFYGVGNAAGVVNPSLKRKATEASARRDLAQEFQVYVAALQRQYLAETTGGSLDRHSVEQHIEDVMKQVTEATLTGSSIVEYWEHPTRNEAYALARLDLAGFLETVKRYRAAAGQFTELDAQLRASVRDNAAEMHDWLRHTQRGPAGTTAQTSPGDAVKPMSDGGRPDPAVFETGDLLWKKQPLVFIPYDARPSATYESDKEDWEREKQAFLDRVRNDPQASEFDRNTAARLESLSFEAFRSQYLGGTDDEHVTAAGWIPWIGHVAMILVRDGQPWVVEATVPKVRVMPYDEWLKHQGKALIWHGRLKDLDAAARAKPVEEALKQVNKPFVFFTFDLGDDRNFYCSKLIWYSIFRAFGWAVDDDPETRRRFWFSPKQLMASRHVRLVTNPEPYGLMSPGGKSDSGRRPVQVVPESGLPGLQCEAAFAQCVSRCVGVDLESCAEACCCQYGGTKCPNAPDCCPNRR